MTSPLERQRVEEQAESVEVLPEIRWQLEEHGPNRRPERADVAASKLDRTDGLRSEPRVMRDALTRLIAKVNGSVTCDAHSVSTCGLGRR